MMPDVACEDWGLEEHEVQERCPDCEHYAMWHAKDGFPCKRCHMDALETIAGVDRR